MVRYPFRQLGFMGHAHNLHWYHVGKNQLSKHEVRYGLSADYKVKK